MPTKTTTPTVAELHEQLTSNCKVRRPEALYRTLATIDGTEPLRPHMQRVIAAAAAHQAATAALAAFDESVASEYELRQGKTAHDWSKPDITRFTPEERAEGERLYHAKHLTYASKKSAETAYTEALRDLAADPDNREAVMTEIERQSAEADAIFLDAVDRLDSVHTIHTAAAIAAGVGLNLRTAQLRKEWQDVRDRQVRALTIERERLAPPAPEPEPDPKPRQRIVERDGVVFIGKR